MIRMWGREKVQGKIMFPCWFSPAFQYIIVIKSTSPALRCLAALGRQLSLNAVVMELDQTCMKPYSFFESRWRGSVPGSAGWWYSSRGAWQSGIWNDPIWRKAYDHSCSYSAKHRGTRLQKGHLWPRRRCRGESNYHWRDCANVHTIPDRN